MKHLILAVLVAASLAGTSLDAKETSIAGTWTLSIEQIGVKLVLEQRKGEFNDAHEIVRVRNQEIPWTAARGLHGVVHFPR